MRRNNKAQLPESVKMGLITTINEFLTSGEENFTFPASLTNVERKFIHEYVRKNGIKSRSYGVGSERQITIFLHKKADRQMSDCTQFELSQDSKRAIFRLLKTFPLTDRERNEFSLARNTFRDSDRKHFGMSTLTNGIPCVPPTCDNKNVRNIRTSLPIFSSRQQIIETINRNQVVVLVGETGSGKTTQVPQYILENAGENNINCRIICTQPRRLSALAVADRVAFERNEETGNTVGFQIRLESKTCPRSNLIYCTNGILVRCLMAGNNRETFKNITHVIIDEVHERDKNSDFLLISLREALKEQPNLKLILMSATIDADIFSKYFNDCPQIFVPGKTFEVKNLYLEDVLRMVGFDKTCIDVKFNQYSNKTEQPPINVELAKANSPSDPETISYLDDLLEKCLKEDDEDNFNQFLFMIDAENVPLDYQHSQTELTLLMIAAARGMTELVDSLLKSNSNPAIETKGGLKAIDLARQMNQIECIKLLENYVPKEKVTIRTDRNLEIDSYSRLLLEAYHKKIDSSAVVDRELIVKLISLIHEELPEGTILVFLPGYEDIIQLNSILSERMNNRQMRQRTRIYMLHSNMKISDQKSVFKPAPQGTRKIILSTNISETSITISDVVYVIDSGKVKQTTFDSHTGSTSLDTVWISKACSKQRAGRAGRVRPGICYKIYSRSQFEWMEDFTVPELLRVPLTEICLSAKLIAPLESIVEFLSKAVMPPLPKNVEKSVELLRQMGALDKQEKITSLGVVLADLPVDAHLGKMIIYSIVLKCVDPILTIVSALSVKSIFSIPFSTEGKASQLEVKRQLSEGAYSDHMVLIRVFQKWLDHASKHTSHKFCEDNFLNSGSLQTVCGMRSLILGHLRANRLIKSSGKGNIHDLNQNSKYWAVVKACIIAGLYPNICQRKKEENLFGHLRFNTSFHQASVLNQNKNIKQCIRMMPTDFVVYEEKIRYLSRLSIDCNTIVTPQAIALFAGSILMNENALYSLTDDLDSDDEERSDASNRMLLKINEWIGFNLSPETANFVFELRRKFNCLLIRMLHNHDHFHMKMDDNDHMTVAAVVEYLIAEDIHNSLAQPSGIGDRPQAVYLDFSADINFGIQESSSSSQCAVNVITKDMTSMGVSGKQNSWTGKKKYNYQTENSFNKPNQLEFNLKNIRFFMVEAQSRTEVKKVFNKGPWTFANSLLNYLKDVVQQENYKSFILFFHIPNNQEVFGCGLVTLEQNRVCVNRLTEKSVAIKDICRQVYNVDWNMTQELPNKAGQLLFAILRP